MFLLKKMISPAASSFEAHSNTDEKDRQGSESKAICTRKKDIEKIFFQDRHGGRPGDHISTKENKSGIHNAIEPLFVYPLQAKLVSPSISTKRNPGIKA
ncbi:MAG: hypothetical protein ACK4NS_06380 [Saprospiraceae bacterium]